MCGRRAPPQPSALLLSFRVAFIAAHAGASGCFSRRSPPFASSALAPSALCALSISLSRHVSLGMPLGMRLSAPRPRLVLFYLLFWGAQKQGHETRRSVLWLICDADATPAATTSYACTDPQVLCLRPTPFPPPALFLPGPPLFNLQVLDLCNVLFPAKYLLSSQFIFVPETRHNL
ncbi:hypothetical protein C8R45DRAFT_630187 [Mycena sanguinolenta]|nr:hypothetical protein C8R45DRAFT_630187 [Mycena sanguinolenta]